MNRPFVDPRTGLFIGNESEQSGGNNNPGASLVGSTATSSDPATTLALQQLLNNAQQQQQQPPFSHHHQQQPGAFLNPGISSLYQPQAQSAQDLLYAQQALQNSSRRGSGLTTGGGGGNIGSGSSAGNDLTLDDFYKLLGNNNSGGGSAGLQDQLAAQQQLQQQAALGGLYNNPFAASLQSQANPASSNSFLMQQHQLSGLGNNHQGQDPFTQNLLLESLNQKVLLAQHQQQQQSGLLDHQRQQLLQLAQAQGGLHQPQGAAALGLGIPDPQQQLQQQQQQQQQPPKAEAPAPKTSLPLRALSAYNFYFRDERERILNGGEAEYTSEKKQALLAGHWFRDRTVKRRHRKTHGKVSFTTLSKLISQRWRELGAEHKEFYRQIAQEDLDRYQRELGNLNGSTTAAATTTAAAGTAATTTAGAAVVAAVDTTAVPAVSEVKMEPSSQASLDSAKAA